MKCINCYKEKAVVGDITSYNDFKFTIHSLSCNMKSKDPNIWCLSCLKTKITFLKLRGFTFSKWGCDSCDSKYLKIINSLFGENIFLA